MYHPDIVERRLHKAKQAGLKFQRLPRDHSIEISSRLEALTKNEKGELLPEGQLIRPLDDREHAFIQSERLLCKADFLYYLSRYHVIDRDPGVGTESGQGPAKPLESQLRMVELIGRRELVCFNEMRTHKFTSGILCYCHKCRQVAFTATSRALSIHRMLFYPGTRAFACGMNEDGQGELYKRDMLSISSLPFWLRPYADQIYPNVKNTEIGLVSPYGTRLMYQAENQQQGIGTGTQQDVSHLTEVPLWKYPGQIRFSFIPSIPKAMSTLHIQEGTSAGKGGYWQEVSEGCRHKRKGYEDHIYIFVPWYLNTTKYRSVPPADWKIDEHTVKHAALIERTSPEFFDGKTYRPSVEQLYWWEQNRALYAHNGELAAFLASYPATPEQSFTNWAQGALPVELIESMELDCRPPRVYEVSTVE